MNQCVIFKVKQNIIYKKNKNTQQIELTERERLVLKSIIHLFISTAEPIGSRVVAKYLQKQLNLSPASIRNVMAELEEYGYLTQTHTSSGRIPTDRGYRYYVDSLIHFRKPSEWEIKIIDEEFKKVEPQNTDEVLKTASKALGFLSKYLSVVIVPGIQNIKIAKIDIFEIISGKLLFVFALESNIVRTLTIEANFEIDKEKISEITSIINERVSGMSLNYVYENFSDIISDSEIKETSLVRLFVNLIGKMVTTFDEKDRALFAGTNYLLKYPEFEDPNKIRNIIQIIENADIVVKLLEQWKNANSTLTILIGTETSNEYMEDYSLVASQYNLWNTMGMIGLIGPKRMNYSKVITLVDYISKFISQNYYLYS